MRFRELPTKVKVGYKDYLIHKMEQCDSTNTGNLAQVKTIIGDVYITPGYTAQETANTILHEVLHALFKVTCLEEILNSSSISPADKEESLITLLTNGLTGIIRDNPKLFPLLAKMLESHEKVEA